MTAKAPSLPYRQFFPCQAVKQTSIIPFPRMQQ